MKTLSINNTTETTKQIIIEMLGKEITETKNQELSTLLRAWKRNDKVSMDDILSSIEDKENLNPIILTLINELEYNSVMSIEEFEKRIQKTTTVNNNSESL